MGLRYGTLRAAAQAVDGRARTLGASGLFDAAEASYEAGLLTLYPALLDDEAGAGQSWRRPALALSDLGHRLVIDALTSSRLGQLQLRCQTLLDIPNALTLTGMADIYEAIAGAITVGAPRYNAGDIVGCVICYWATIQALLGATPVRGFAGHARVMGRLREVVEVEAPMQALTPGEIDALAWTLRQALDDAARIIG